MNYLLLHLVDCSSLLYILNMPLDGTRHKFPLCASPFRLIIAAGWDIVVIPSECKSQCSRAAGY